MTAVLLGRQDAPLSSGVETLMEVANAYYARAAEITISILRQEADDVVKRGDRRYRFRTGELRTFMELAKACMDLGSRRITLAVKEYEQREDY